METPTAPAPAPSGITATISAKITINATVYDLSVDIPSGAPTNASPYIFSIAEESSTTPPPAPLLYLKVGDLTGDKASFEFDLAPPSSALPSQVSDLTLSVKEGTFS